jgi:hypothetical protein
MSKSNGRLVEIDIKRFGFGGSVVIGGVDISEYVDGIEVRYAVGSAPRVLLSISSDVKLRGQAADVIAALSNKG